MWNNVVLDFGEEETAMFGPRLEIAGTNNLYEVHTVATVSSTAEVKEVPPITTHSSQEFIAIAVDSCLTIFKNECSELWFNLNFDSKVEQLAISQDSQLLLIGEHCGALHIYYLPGRHQILNIPLIAPVDNSKSYKSIFIVPENDSTSSSKASMVVFGNEQLFVFYHVNMDNIRTGAIAEDWTNIQQHLMSVKRVQFPLSEMYPEIEVEMIFPVADGSKQLVLGYCVSGVHPLAIGSVEDSNIRFSFFEEDINFRKVEVTSDGLFLFALDKNSHVNIICPSTLFLKKTLKTKVISDFSLIESTDASGDVIDRKLMCLSTVEEGQILEILQFPSLSILYSLKMSSSVHLMNVLANQENVYVIEGVCEDVENSKMVTSLRVRQISEALPEARLAQLLRKRKYDEAEKFAQMFNLDVQDVYMAKINALMDSISPWLPEPLALEDTENVLLQVKNLLRKIKDLRFLVESCLNATPSTLKFMEDLLFYARENVIQRKSQDSTTKWLKQINESLNRLLTFKELYPSESEWCSWFRFKQCNLVQEFLQLLKNEKTDKAFVLWQRHKIELCDMLTNDVILEILASIPENIPSKELAIWLQDSFFVPVFNSSHSSVEDLAKWMVQRAQILELSEKDGWPENSLHLLQILPDTCEKMLSTCEQGGSSVDTELSLQLLQRIVVLSKSSFKALLALIMDLNELVILRRKYKCPLSLAEFCQEDKLSVVFLILDWLVGTKHMDEAVTCFLTKFIKSASLDANFVFSLYIKDILAAFPVGWWHWEEAPWEERVFHILKYIYNPNEKLKATLDILPQAPVPWSSAISALVEEQLENGIGKGVELETHKQLADLKVVLAKYNIRNYNMNDVENAERLMRFILEQSKPMALDNILVVANSFSHITESDPYFKGGICLLKNDEMDEFATFLKCLPGKTLKICVRRLLTFIDGLLYPSKWTDKNLIKIMTYGGVYATNHLIEVFPEYADEFHPELIALQRVWRMQVEYGLFNHPNDVTTQEGCWKIFNSQMEKLLSEQSADKESSGDDGQRFTTTEEQSHFDVYRLGLLLGLSEDEVTGCLAVLLTKKGETFKAAEICLELSSTCSYSKTGPVLLNVVQHFYENLGTILDSVSTEMFQAVYKTITQATVYCEMDILHQCQTVAAWTSLVCSLCAMETQTSQQKQEGKDWNFSNFYEDRGLRIERRCYLPHLVTLINLTCFCEDEMDESHHSSLVSSLRHVIVHLKSKGQEVAALQVLLLATVTILEQQLIKLAHQDEVLSAMRSSHYDIVKALLSRIVNAKVVDKSISLGLLCSLESKSLQCFKELMQTCGGEFGRLMSITAVGVSYGQMIQIPKIVQKCEMIHKNACWGGRLAQFHISLKDIQILESTKNVWRVLRDLFLCPTADVGLVLQFCEEFDVDRDCALFEYLQSLLLGVKMQDWSMATEEKASTILKALLTKADIIVQEFRDRNELLRCLKSILTKLNSYCYEAIQFVLVNLSRLCSSDDEMKVRSDKGLGLIGFLNIYKRANVPPSSVEMDLWLGNENQPDQLPHLASVRLPFYPLLGQDKWKIITGELSAATVDDWLSVSSLLNLDHDQLLVISVQNTFTKWMAKTQSRPDAAKQTGHQLLDVLQGLGKKISKSEVATACSIWVLKRLPIGPTKVEVARLAAQLAKRWAMESKDENSRESLKKFTQIYHRLAVEQVLHDYGFTDPEYFALSQKPAELITYMLENSTSSNKIFTSYYSKSLHSAVKEIAAIGECVLGELCDALLEKWLPHPEVTQSVASEQTVTLNFNWANVTSHEEKDNLGTNLNRTINLLQYAPLEASILEQLSVVLKESPTATTMQKVQALRCLFVVADDKTIEQVSGQESGVTWKMLNELMYVARLESINLPYSLEMFHAWNKGDLVESILQSHSQNTKALLLASSICMQYELWDEHLWETILTNMIQMKMSANLQSVLLKLSSKSFLWHNSAFIAAWNCVLKAVLRRESINKDNQALDTYFMLMSCPCFMDIDLDFFISEFRSLGCIVPALACSLLKPKAHSNTNLLPTPQLCSEIKEILTKVHGLKHRLVCFSQVSQFADENSDY